LANDYVTYKIIYQLISDNSEKVIEPILDKSLASMKAKFPKLMQKGADFSMTKLKLIEEIKTSNENRFIKKIIVFCLDQVYLADVDLNKENVSFEEILKIKIIQILKGITEPTRIWILLVILFQWLVVLFI
jgi:CMP-N-acetylneuraminic acid synthetase